VIDRKLEKAATKEFAKKLEQNEWKLTSKACTNSTIPSLEVSETLTDTSTELQICKTVKF
jgi:hypothetical protein